MSSLYTNIGTINKLYINNFYNQNTNYSNSMIYTLKYFFIIYLYELILSYNFWFNFISIELASTSWRTDLELAKDDL